MTIIFQQPWRLMMTEEYRNLFSGTETNLTIQLTTRIIRQRQGNFFQTHEKHFSYLDSIAILFPMKADNEI